MFLSGILGLFALGFDDWRKLQNDQEAKVERNQLHDQITNLTSRATSQSSQIKSINSNQLALTEQNQTLLRELATNSSINLDLRQRIADSNRRFETVGSQITDLNAWETQLKSKLENRQVSLKIQREQAIQGMQSEYERGKPLYDYAIRTLTDMLGKIATLKGDKVSSNYQGLPSLADPDLPNLNVGETKFLINSNWDFQAILVGPENNHRSLRIHSKNPNTPSFEIGIVASESGNFGTYLHIPGEDSIDIIGPVAEYKKTIDEALGNLIAAEVIRLSNTNQTVHP